MCRCALMVCVLIAAAVCAEDRTLVPQFSLADGRTIQAVRLIKIDTPMKTSYLATLADGSKVSFTGDDVLKMTEVYIPVSATPPSLNVVKKPEPVVVVVERPAPPQSPEPPPYVAEQEPYYPYYYYNNAPQRPHRPSPPPPPAPNTQTPSTALTAGDRARQAFSTIPSFQAKK